MTVQAEFIASTGAYQHVKLTFEARDGHDLSLQLKEFSDEMKVQLGVFEAEFVSWTSDTYSRAIDGQEIDAVKLMADAMGATVVEETKIPDAPAKPTKQKPWDKKVSTASTADIDNF
jgi:hypothetical protein